MRMITAKLSYIFNGEEKEKELEERRKRLGSIGVSVPIDQNLDNPTIALTEKQYIDLLVLKEDSPTIIGVTEIGATVDSAIDKLTYLAEKMEAFSSHVGKAQFNEKIEVYTPGMGLMLFNKVMLLEDACSDDLQNQLDSGWKIIAACPQPNQRRPDYILGRYDAKHALNSGAATNAERGSN